MSCLLHLLKEYDVSEISLMFQLAAAPHSNTSRGRRHVIFQPRVKDPISLRVRARGALTAAPTAPDGGPSAASRWAGGVVASRWDVKGRMRTRRGS